MGRSCRPGARHFRRTNPGDRCRCCTVRVRVDLELDRLPLVDRDVRRIALDGQVAGADDVPVDGGFPGSAFSATISLASAARTGTGGAPTRRLEMTTTWVRASATARRARDRVEWGTRGPLRHRSAGAQGRGHMRIIRSTAIADMEPRAVPPRAGAQIARGGQNPLQAEGDGCRPCRHPGSHGPGYVSSLGSVTVSLRTCAADEVLVPVDQSCLRSCIDA